MRSEKHLSVLLIVLLWAIAPFVCFSQQKAAIEEEDTVNAEEESLKNRVEIGVHTSFLLGEMVVSAISDRKEFSFPTTFHLQGGYKRELEHLTLRAGIGGGYTYSSHFQEWGGGTLILNVGVEKTVWKLSEVYEMSFALDLADITRWDSYDGIKWFEPRSERTYRSTGMGVTWGNRLILNPRSSITLEAGLGYGKYGYPLKGERMTWAERGWGFIRSHRKFVLSYNYHY